MKEDIVMSESAGKQVDVDIACIDGICKVTPADVVVATGDTVNFRNLTGGDISIQFSEECLFSKEKENVVKDATRPFPVQMVQRGVYPYAVYCECTKDFAVGASMPIIIIKR
jgi:plastocyanin